MNRFLIVLVMSFVCFSSQAQVFNPVKWTFSADRINATTYKVHLSATIEPGWHIYSQTTQAGGPIPTAISFNKNPLLSLTGVVEEKGKLESRHEPLFGVEVKQYSQKVDFIQVVKLKSNAKTSVTGTVEFMVCNDKECLPPKTEKFSISLK